MWVFNTKLNRDVNEVLSNVETEKDLLILSKQAKLIKEKVGTYMKAGKMCNA